MDIVLLFVVVVTIFSSCNNSETPPNSDVRNLHLAYIHELGAGPFPVVFYTERAMASFSVYHTGSRLHDAGMRKNNTQFKFTMDPSDSSNVGVYEIVFNEGLASEFRQNTSLHLKLEGQLGISVVGAKEMNDNELLIACEVIGLLGNPKVLVRNDRETIGSSSTADQIVNKMAAVHMKYEIAVTNDHKPQIVYCEIDAQVVDRNKKLKSTPFSLEFSTSSSLEEELEEWKTAAIISSVLLGFSLMIICVLLFFKQKQIWSFSSSSINSKENPNVTDNNKDVEMNLLESDQNQSCESENSSSLEQTPITAHPSAPSTSCNNEKEESTLHVSNGICEFKHTNGVLVIHENETNNATFQTDSQEIGTHVLPANGEAKQFHSNNIKSPGRADTDVAKKPLRNRMNQRNQNGIVLPDDSNSIVTNGNHTSESTPLTTDVDSDVDTCKIQANSRTFRDTSESIFTQPFNDESTETRINNGDHLVKNKLIGTTAATQESSSTYGHIQQNSHKSTAVKGKTCTTRMSCP